MIIAVKAVAEKIAEPVPQKQETHPEKSEAQAPSGEPDQETQPKLTLQNLFPRSVTLDDIGYSYVASKFTSESEKTSKEIMLDAFPKAENANQFVHNV